ncbi:MAG: 4Fe-4S dicluster domain-containing protein [Anaerolineae bacterium]
MFGLGLAKGLIVTMRHFIDSYIYDRRPWQWLTTSRYDEKWLERHQAIDGKGMFTIQYPEQKRIVPERFRFLPMLIYEDNPDLLRCTACGICARVCPPQCIWIERGTDKRGRPTADPSGFWIDAVICMSCGYCAEYCPFDAIKMSHAHETTTTDRDRDMWLDIHDLSVSLEYYASLHPTDFATEQEWRAEQAEAKRQAAEAKGKEYEPGDKPAPRTQYLTEPQAAATIRGVRVDTVAPRDDEDEG